MRYRYPGVQAYTRDDGALFFGRRHDEERLYKLARLEKLIVLYGKSGYGKSSLLQAAVLPRIERETAFVAVPTRFYPWNQEQENSASPLQRAAQALRERMGGQADTAGAYLGRLLPGDNSLWRHFKMAQAATGNGRFFLVFDQFEEIFSYPETAVLQFRAELAELLYSDIPQYFRDAFDNADPPTNERDSDLFFDALDIRVVFSIRSDYLHLLNRLKDFLPQVLRHCYELDALSPEQAREAIVEPASREMPGEDITPVFTYDPDTLNLLIRFFSKGGKEKIESFQLQLICRHIEEKFVREQNRMRIESDMFGADESQRMRYLQDVYRNYYASCIEQLPPDWQKVARLIVENELVTPEDKRRIPADAGMLVSRYRAKGASAELLEALKNTYLLRAEAGPRGVAFELSHDALVEPILRARAEREEVEARAAHEKQLQEAREKARIEAQRRRLALALALVSCLATLVAAWKYWEAEQNLAARLKAEEAKKQTQLTVLQQEMGILSQAGEYQLALLKALEAREIDSSRTWILDSIKVFEKRLEEE